MNKEDVLRDYGLSDNEIKAYLANLQLGTAKANDIAIKANLLRTTTYEVLKSLVEKGLASSVIKSGVKFFDAIPPKRLISILEERKSKISSIIPELESLRQLNLEKPKVEIFEGREGLKAILDDIINSQPKEILQLNSSKIFETLHYYFPKWINRRVKTNIKTRILQEKTKIIQEYKKKDKQELREIRFLPKDFQIKTTNFIYNDKIAILTLKEGEIIGLRIKNKDIITTQKSIFETLWKTAKK